MNKRYLPAIASLLIIAITLTSFTPVFAALPTMLAAQPTLRVTTIAEDDELRATGVMFLADSPDAFTVTDYEATYPADLMSQFKIIISYNGVPVTPDSIYCQFVEKDKAQPLKNKQFTAENLVSVPKENSNFICKYREGKPGVGVLDVYYTGSMSAEYIADYILVVGASLAVGRTTVYGTEIQDICLLGWPVDGTDAAAAAGPDYENVDTGIAIWADALGGFISCEDAALLQHQALGLPIPWT
jgi:hypothetical protein